MDQQGQQGSKVLVEHLDQQAVQELLEQLGQLVSSVQLGQ